MANENALMEHENELIEGLERDADFEPWKAEKDRRVEMLSSHIVDGFAVVRIALGLRCSQCEGARSLIPQDTRDTFATKPRSKLA